MPKQVIEFSPQQELFFEKWMETGDAVEAHEYAGYATSTKIADIKKAILKHPQFREHFKAELPVPQALKTIQGYLDPTTSFKKRGEPGYVDKDQAKLAVEVLDRVGIIKEQKVDVTSGGEASPIFLLPQRENEK